MQEQEEPETLDLLRGLPRRDVVVHVIGNPQVGKLTAKRSLDNLIRYCLSVLSQLDSLPPQNISVVIGNPPPEGEADVAVGRILLCVFDISDVESFKAAERLLAPFKLRSKLTRVLVGNKIDLEYWRKVEVGSGVSLAQAMCCKYCEISAHTGMHVDLIVDLVLREMFAGMTENRISKILEICLGQKNNLRDIEKVIKDLEGMGAEISSELRLQGDLLQSLDVQMDRPCPKKEKKKVARKHSVNQMTGGIDRRRIRPTVELSLPEEQQEVLIEEEEAISPLQSNSISFPSEAPPQRKQSLGLLALEEELELTKSIMMTNMEKVMERSEKLDQIQDKSELLSAQAGTFKKSSHTLKRKMAIADCAMCLTSVFCCPCFFADWLWGYLKSLSTKASLFDNVLADTENAFQSLAKLLVYLKEWTELALSPCLYVLFGGLLNLLSGIVSFVVVLSSTIVLILPSFFTLLIVRTSTVEKESKAFGGEWDCLLLTVSCLSPSSSPNFTSLSTFLSETRSDSTRKERRVRCSVASHHSTISPDVVLHPWVALCVGA